MSVFYVVLVCWAACSLVLLFAICKQLQNPPTSRKYPNLHERGSDGTLRGGFQETVGTGIWCDVEHLFFQEGKTTLTTSKAPCSGIHRGQASSWSTHPLGYQRVRLLWPGSKTTTAFSKPRPTSYPVETAIMWLAVCSSHWRAVTSSPQFSAGLSTNRQWFSRRSSPWTSTSVVRLFSFWRR